MRVRTKVVGERRSGTVGRATKVASRVGREQAASPTTLTPENETDRHADKVQKFTVLYIVSTVHYVVQEERLRPLEDAEFIARLSC